MEDLPPNSLRFERVVACFEQRLDIFHHKNRLQHRTGRLKWFFLAYFFYYKKICGVIDVRPRPLKSKVRLGSVIFLNFCHFDSSTLCESAFPWASRMLKIDLILTRDYHYAEAGGRKPFHDPEHAFRGPGRLDPGRSRIVFFLRKKIHMPTPV